MKKARFAVFGLILAGGITFAMSGLLAQSRPERRSQESSRPRMMMLDGRGSQLGVVVKDLDNEGLKAAAGAPSGVRIGEVEQESPAAKAGLREGDIVVELDGDRVRSARQFSRLVQETPEGRSVALGIVRDGKRQSVNVTPEARGAGIAGDRIERDVARSLGDIEPRLRDIEPRLRELGPLLREFQFDRPLDFDGKVPRMTSPRGRLGVQLGDLTPQLAEYFGAKDGGVLLSSITKDSPADKAGLKAGDVITSVNGDRVRDAGDVIDKMGEVGRGEITLGILRDKKESTVKVVVEESTAPARRPGRPV